MATLMELGQQFEIGSLDHLIEDIEIPVLTGPQAQGDVFWMPMRAGKIDGLVEVGPEGFILVKGENGGNTHVLFAQDGPVYVSPAPPRSQRLCSVEVPEGSVAVIGHREHGFNAVGPGQYVFNRQRQQMDEIRLTQD